MFEGSSRKKRHGATEGKLGRQSRHKGSILTIEALLLDTVGHKISKLGMLLAERLHKGKWTGMRWDIFCRKGATEF